MNKDKSIIISQFEKGVSDSILSGAESIVGCEIFEEFGVLKIKERSKLDSTRANDNSYFNVTGLPIADVTDNAGVRTILTDNGVLFSGTNADFLLASNLSKGWDAVVWDNNYTLVSYTQSGVGYIGVINNTGIGNQWNPALIGSLTGTYAIKLLMGQDGFCYFTNGQFIGRITNISTDLITGITTVTSTSNALDLKRGVYAVSMAELGANLLIGTQKGGSYSVKGNFNFANIYPWDRTSASFRLPVRLNENGVNAMISKDNQVYVSAGINGAIYVTDGTNYQKIKEIPFSRIRKFGASAQVYLNAMCFDQMGNLLVATSTLSDATPNTTTTHGVWEIRLSSGYPINLAYTLINNAVGQDFPVYIGYVRTKETDTVAFGTLYSNIGEIVETDFIKNDNYKATYDTGFYVVGNFDHKKTYEHINILFLEPLISGQSIKVSYRKNPVESFTELGTWGFSEIGNVISHSARASISDVEMVQFRIQLTQNTTTPFPSNVRLVKIEIT